MKISKYRILTSFVSPTLITRYSERTISKSVDGSSRLDQDSQTPPGFRLSFAFLFNCKLLQLLCYQRKKISLKETRPALLGSIQIFIKNAGDADYGAIIFFSIDHTRSLKPEKI